MYRSNRQAGSSDTTHTEILEVQLEQTSCATLLQYSTVSCLACLLL